MKIGTWTLPDPWPWQLQEDAQFGDQSRRGIIASPRMGKTNAVAVSLRRRARDGFVRRGLVTAPLKVCETWDAVLTGAGLPPGMAAILADSDRAAAHGALEVTGDDLPRLLGRPVTPLADVLKAALSSLA